MTIGSLTPLHRPTAANKLLSIDEVRSLVAKQLNVEVESITSDTHFANDLGADLIDRVELMLAVEDHFAGVEITDEDIEQIQLVGDLIRHLNTQYVK